MKSYSAYISLILAAFLLLGSCSKSSSRNDGIGPTPGNDPGTAGDPSSILPISIDQITTENAELLTRSMMSMIGRLAAIGEVTTTVVLKGAGLLTNPSRQPGDAVGMPECNDALEPGPGTNQISFEINQPGFFVPPGQALRAAFSQCSIEGFLVNGTVEVAAISYGGDLASEVANWELQATAVLGPFQIHNPNGTQTSYTDKYKYRVARSGSVLTTDLEIAADPDTGVIGGLNAQHFLTLPTTSQSVVNYQFRPFRLRTVDNADTGEYTVIVQASPEGDSLLNRYTATPSGEIKLTVATAGLSPIVWLSGKPESHLEVPAAGEIGFVENGRSIVATVESDGVLLTITIGGSVTTETIEWTELLTAPES